MKIVKKLVFSQRDLPTFVTSGCPPDVVHEGTVPVELVQCLRLLMSKMLFSLVDLNNHIKNFQYRWAEKKNPHLVPHNFAFYKTIGGNAHENWCLRLLPFMVI